MSRLVSGQEGCESSKREVNTGEGHQIRLELVEVNVERTIEPERSRDGRYNLSNQAVKVGEAWLRDTQTLLADVENGFVINLQCSAG